MRWEEIQHAQPAEMLVGSSMTREMSRLVLGADTSWLE